ncbi:MAG: hypothetical protein A2901_03050 [Elusimicrobia bacterium RIFCSPLOWO2_01_FULL_54_10]|nr:MAG: hypothetical protein A2901_03050 [Elusimicrobia bacterium RIFCSPLOWO2_01_FULL_54_10]
MTSAFEPRDEAPKSAVTLTIDRTLQYYAEKELKAGVEEFQAKSGMILIQDPRTGDILAMASYPHFDPNILSKGTLPENFNRKWLDNPAVSHLFEPGSTLKVVTFAAALEEKAISSNEMFNCEGGKWKVAGAVINDHEPQGLLTASQVLEKSSNIGTAKVGLKLGAERFYRYVRAFGFGTRTGLPIPGETDGLFREPRKWTPQSLPVLSFGQEIGVTAVQLIGAFSAVANGGLLMEPRVTRTENQAPRMVRRVVSAKTCATLNEMMRAVVERGTGSKARVPGFTVCGKTGTAQKIDPKTRKYSDEKYVASFCGFLPAKNPALVGLVILDEPRTTYWGGETAAPVFSRVMSRAVTVLDIPPPKAALLADGVKSAQEVRLLASKSGR